LYVVIFAPLLGPGSQLTTAEAARAVAATETGTPGAVLKVKGDELKDAPEVPTAFVAVTLKL
jgi:hypothetical protein